MESAGAIALPPSDELDARTGSAVFTRDASYRKRTIPRPTSLPVHRLTAADMAALDAPQELEHSDVEMSPQLADRVPSALLPPVQQRPLAHGSVVNARTFGSSRMAFMRRPKRTDSAVSKTRRTAQRDVDHSADDASVAADDQYVSDVPIINSHSLPDLPSQPPMPEGSLKKRVNRIEKTIAEQTAWVISKFELDESDTLLDSCSAALVRKIMHQGRLHITSSYMCFYAKIFGSVTKEKWAFNTIQSVKKRRGGFVANSIKITFANSDTPPVIIASLNRREQTLAIIAARLAVLGPALTETPYRGASVDDDSEEQSDGINHAPDHNRSDRSNSSTPHLSVSDAASRVSGEGHASCRGSDSASEDMPATWDGRSASAPTIEYATQAALDKLVWSSPGDSMDMIAGKEYAKRTEQVRGSFNVPAIFVFNELFIGDWYKTYHAEINNVDVQGSDWYKEDDGFMRRDLSFRRPLGYRIGPKETRVKETQRYCFTANGGVRIECEGYNLDVPFGEYFRVESYLELEPTSNGQECELVTSLSVHFMKSTMLKSKIEAGALSETKLTFAKLVEMGKERIGEAVPKSHVSALLQRKESQKAAAAPQSKPRRNARSSRPTARKPAKVALQPEKVNVRQASLSRPVTPIVAEQPKTPPPDPAAVGAPRSKAATQVAQPNGATFVQVPDPLSPQLLRMVTLAVLVLVCILLLLVLLSFRRMKTEFKVLQTIVREMQATSATRAASVCSK